MDPMVSVFDMAIHTLRNWMFFCSMLLLPVLSAMHGMLGSSRTDFWNHRFRHVFLFSDTLLKIRISKPLKTVNADYYIAKRHGIDIKQINSVWTTAMQAHPDIQNMQHQQPQQPVHGYPQQQQPVNGYPQQQQQPQQAMPGLQAYRPLPVPPPEQQLEGSSSQIYTGHAYPPLPGQRMPDYNGQQNLYPAAENGNNNEKKATVAIQQKETPKEDSDHEDDVNTENENENENERNEQNLGSVYVPKEEDFD